MRYVARTAIKQVVDGKEQIIAPGKDVPEDLVSDYLVGVGAIEPIEDDELFQADEPAGGGGAKPLSRMTKAELLARAAEVGAEVPDNATNPDIVKLIEAKAPSQA